jgi:7-carboxy-7-deazaguanine synthase
MEVDSIVEKVDSFGVRHAVITGGEPMIFDATEALATRLKELGYTITIETAGTVFRSLPCDLMSISPKLANSTPEDGEWADRHETTRFNPQAIARLIATYPYQLKFVVNPEIEGDLPEIDEMLAAIGDVDQSHILLMPEGTDSETLWRRARLLIEPCMQRNWRLAPRLHIDLFGNKRGT